MKVGVRSLRVIESLFYYMAEGKKGFVLYADQKTLFDDLTSEEAGLLIKHIFSYVNDENPILENRIIQIAFNPIKQQLKRDLVKYQSIKERNSINARKRWDAVASNGKPNDTKNADIDNVIVNDIDNVNDKVKVKVKDINYNIDERKLKFAHSLKEFTDIYGREMIKEFYGYWTEPNKSNTKFKQEMQKTWDLKRRLETWANNQKNFGKAKTDNTFENRAANLTDFANNFDWKA
jgi:hypothetical protein